MLIGLISSCACPLLPRILQRCFGSAVVEVNAKAILTSNFDECNTCTLSKLAKCVPPDDASPDETFCSSPLQYIGCLVASVIADVSGVSFARQRVGSTCTEKD